MANHYLFISLQAENRDARIETLKKNLFSTKEALKFDFEVLDGAKISSKELGVALYSYPAVAAKKLVVVRDAGKLKEDSLDVILKFLDDTQTKVVLVLDAQTWDGRGELKKKIKERLQPAIASVIQKTATVFDMMDMVFQGSVVSGLKLLKTLSDQEEEIALLGGMIWYWSHKVKGRISSLKYKKGLLILQEADEYLKRQKFPEKSQGLEFVLIKLTSLLRA